MKQSIKSLFRKAYNKLFRKKARGIADALIKNKDGYIVTKEPFLSVGDIIPFENEINIEKVEISTSKYAYSDNGLQ